MAAATSQRGDALPAAAGAARRRPPRPPSRREEQQQTRRRGGGWRRRRHRAGGALGDAERGAAELCGGELGGAVATAARRRRHRRRRRRRRRLARPLPSARRRRRRRPPPRAAVAAAAGVGGSCPHLGAAAAPPPPAAARRRPARRRRRRPHLGAAARPPARPVGDPRQSTRRGEPAPRNADNGTLFRSGGTHSHHSRSARLVTRRSRAVGLGGDARVGASRSSAAPPTSGALRQLDAIPQHETVDGGRVGRPDRLSRPRGQPQRPHRPAALVWALGRAAAAAGGRSADRRLLVGWGGAWTGWVQLGSAGGGRGGPQGLAAAE